MRRGVDRHSTLCRARGTVAAAFGNLHVVALYFDKRQPGAHPHQSSQVRHNVVDGKFVVTQNLSKILVRGDRFRDVLMGRKSRYKTFVSTPFHIGTAVILAFRLVKFKRLTNKQGLFTYLMLGCPRKHCGRRVIRKPRPIVPCICLSDCWYIDYVLRTRRRCSFRFLRLNFKANGDS